MKKRGNPVLIDWLDAASHQTGWTQPDTIELKALPITTVGIFVKRTKNEFIVALNHSAGQGYFSEYMVIPTRWIQKVKWLK